MTAWATLALAIVTAILAAFTYKLWRENKTLVVSASETAASQAIDMKNSIAEATRTANAMESVALATRENAERMSGMLTKQMRAYVAVNIGKATAQRGNFKFGSTPEIVNVGLTPAKNVSYRVSAAILQTGLPRDYAFPEPQQVFTNDATLNPRQSFTISTHVQESFEQSEVIEISNAAQKRLYVWGAITYDDVYGGHQETKFCHNFYFFDMADPETGKTLHQFNGFYFAGHNDAT